MFQFSLQTALDVRSRQEKIKMKDLAEKLAIEQYIIDQIDQINDNTRQADLNLNVTKQSGVFTIEQMKYLSNFKQRMKVVLADCFESLEKAKAGVVKSQQALIEASRSKKTLEILKEKEQKRFMEKITKTERRNMDEIAGNLFVQKKRTNQT